MRVAVTGAGGRLGRALIEALGEAPFTGPAGPIAWSRADFDLDAPAAIHSLLDRYRPEVVVHTAAWTDVDGCAREPELALARNAEAVGIVAGATAGRGIDLIHVSTNEVFDGTRPHDRGYLPDDPPSPGNPYGISKLAGEAAAAAAYREADARLAIVRTSWLYGPPGNDFPTKILGAAERASGAGAALTVVGDEYGSPTYTRDIADAIVDLLGSDDPDAAFGTHHLVNTGVASRADWARELVRRLGVEVEIDEGPASTWQRASTPPLWG
ncbi:MAG TPA: NAD(P)-dependent oxidoreductase, partial [Candidatus Limnocylindrales bacterium]|nr:NAD(P)-dependent oxidoreductase [Candidatus Limnocylindrales bacterium]